MAKYIYRHDIEKQHIGWYVVIEHRGSAIRRYFSDATYGGGKVNSLMAALEFRNTKLQELGLPITDRKIATRLRKTNTSGVTGVCISGQYCHAYFPIQENQVLRKKFSVLTHGEDDAIQKAKQWRMRLEKAVYGMLICDMAN